MYCGQNETRVGDLDVKVGCRSKQQCPASLQFSPGFTKDLYGRILQQLMAVLRGRFAWPAVAHLQFGVAQYGTFKTHNTLPANRSTTSTS